MRDIQACALQLLCQIPTVREFRAEFRIFKWNAMNEKPPTDHRSPSRRKGGAYHNQGIKIRKSVTRGRNFDTNMAAQRRVDFLEEQRAQAPVCAEQRRDYLRCLPGFASSRVGVNG